MISPTGGRCRSQPTIAEPGNAPAGIWQSFDLDEQVRSVRFVFLNPNGDAQIGGIAEIEVRRDPRAAGRQEMTPSYSQQAFALTK